MPMVTITLPCGCPVVEAYVPRVPWRELSGDVRKQLLEQAQARHECRKPAPKPTETTPA